MYSNRMSNEELLSLIRSMEKEREDSCRAPSHILYRDLVVRVALDDCTIRKQLNALYKQKKIQVGDTINDKYIHAK